MRIERKTLGIVLFSVFFAGLARGLVFRQVFPVYPRTEESIALLQRLQANVSDAVDELIGEAKISLRTEPSSVATSVTTIACARAQSSPDSGWKSASAGHRWTARRSTDSLSIAFAPFPPARAPRIPPHGRSELWIDYADVSAKNTSVIGVEMEFAGRRFISGEWRSADVNAFALYAQVLVRRLLDVTQAHWLRKDAWYTLRKWLRMRRDASWRFTHWGRCTVLQRRFHEPLRDVGELDLVFRSGAPIKGINLRVSSRDDVAPGELIELAGGVPQKDETGRWVLHIDAKAISNQRFPDIDDVYLQELTIFIESLGDEALSRLQQVIFKIARSSLSKSKQKGAKLLPARAIATGSNRRRVIVDLSPIQYEGADLLLKSGLLNIVPTIASEPGGLRIGQVRLVTISDRASPAALLLGRNMASRWGGPFIDFTGGSSVEWPKIDAYLPFSQSLPREVSFSGDPKEQLMPWKSPASAKQRSSPDSMYAVRDPAEWDGRPQDSRAEETIPAVSHRLRMSKALMELRKVKPDEEGYVLEGTGRWFDLDWRVSADVDSRSRLFIGFGEGDLDVKAVSVTVELENGRSAFVEMMPNRAVELGMGKGRVRRVRARFQMLESPFHLRLKEMVIFRPLAAPAAAVFDERYPVSATMKLIPSHVSSAHEVSLSVSSGSLRGTMGAANLKAGPLSWMTTLERPVDWVEGLRLVYHLPAEMISSNPCWLGLRFEMLGGRITRYVCTRDSSGSLFIPWKNLAGAADHPARFGALRAVRWSMRAGKTSPERFVDPSFSFEAEIKGVGMRSLRDSMQSWPAVTIGTSTLVSLGTDRRLVERLAKGSVWLHLDHHAVRSMLADGSGIGSVENPFFSLDSVVLKPRRPLSQGAWEEPPPGSAPAVGARGRWIQRFLGLILAVGLLYLWRPVKDGCMRCWGALRASVESGTSPTYRRVVSMVLWILLAGGFYWQGLSTNGGQAEVYWISLGALALVPLLLRFVRRMSGRPGAGLSSLLGYSEQGASRYLIGALLMIIVAALLTIFKLDRIAEQAGAVAYFCLLIGACVSR